ncbi:MAG: PAS domain S-box protein [Rhizobiales bacterium]|nr:PAS domain S-box protein [Hyphomicrobiales bacterium]
MNNAEFQLRGVHDARLAVHAISASPSWLWTFDGARVLWANPVGVALLGATDAGTLAARTFSPADQQRRQVAHLAGRLSSNAVPRLERLRGFGAPLGSLVTCICTRLPFANGDSGILIVAATTGGRAMPLDERLRRIVETVEMPMAAFTHDGKLVGASETARALLNGRNLVDIGLGRTRDDALSTGHAEATIDAGHVTLQRIGSGNDIGLIATIAPAIMPTAILPVDNASPEPIAPPPPESIEPTMAHASPSEAIVDRDNDANVPMQDAPVADEMAASTSEVDAAATPKAAPTDDPVEVPKPIWPHASDHDEAETADASAPAPRTDLPAADHVAQGARAAASVNVSPPRDAVQPVRFVWQMDADGRFLLGSDDFMRLIGTRTAGAFGRPWDEIVAALDLDPQGLVAKAVATHETWSGITLNWPVDNHGQRLPVELSGLPVFDRARSFAGYRGFGVCRDLARLSELANGQHTTLFHDLPAPRPLAADVPHASAPSADAAPMPPSHEHAPSPVEASFSPPTDPDTTLDNVLENSQNVVPFRLAPDAKLPTLTPVENNAFHELARQLSARLESETGETETPSSDHDDAAANVDAPTRPEAGHNETTLNSRQPPTLPHGESARDTQLLDLMPSGVLIYRLERLLYVNRAFLSRLGFNDPDTLHAAGGLDALYIDPADAVANSINDAGAAVTIATQNALVAPAQAHLSAIAWDGEPALALILTDTAHTSAAAPAAVAITSPPPPADGRVNAEELGAILDTMAEGVVMFDGGGRISACNRSAEALFGVSGDELTRRTLSELFAPESEKAVRDYFDSIANADAASLLDHGREVLGRVHEGGFLPLAMTMGRTMPGSPNYFAVFRDLTQSKKDEAAQHLARRQTERAATAKADVLARVSHEIRTPLNAIIGFADVMIDERFGPLGHERYTEYLKDIRASGERVSSIVDEMLDLSRAETGKLDLAFGRHNLNDLLEQCVAVMQPRANRERIIIRTSLAHTLPDIVADARTLRQVALNLIGNSIRLANAGGQVIVSTALSDEGDVVLRVRDTGHGMNDNELAAAVEPFGTPMPDQTPGHVGVSLALTKALVEANRARFQIKSVPRSGTLIEVTFPQVTARA